MSSIAIKWARSQNFGSAALKSVVNALALRVDNKGATWAAQATLAQDIGMSDRNLRTHLKTLAALGVIQRTVRSRGRYGRASDLIIIALHRRFDISAKDLRAVRNRLAEESSNRKKSTLPRPKANWLKVRRSDLRQPTMYRPGKASPASGSRSARSAAPSLPIRLSPVGPARQRWRSLHR